MNVNYLAILVAAIINMVVGSLWYSPVLFLKSWSKSIGKTEKDMQKDMKMSMGVTYGLAFVGALLMAYVLANIINFGGVTMAYQGAAAGFWSWLGFVVPVSLSGVLFEQKPWKWFMITASYYLVVLLINGALLALWG